MLEWLTVNTSLQYGTNKESSLGYFDSKHRRNSVSQPYDLTLWTSTRRATSTRPTTEASPRLKQITIALIVYASWIGILDNAVDSYTTRPSRLLKTEYLELSLLDTLLDKELEQVKPQERPIETICRVGALFGSGWFFEWPGGKHPLSSTWPWADVKPSLLVLWGVCWMFVIAHTTLDFGRGGYSQVHDSPGRDPNFSGPRPPPSADHYQYLTPSTATQTPVVKRESLGQHNHALGDDWPLFQPAVSPLHVNEAYQNPNQSQNHNQHQNQNQNQNLNPHQIFSTSTSTSTSTSASTPNRTSHSAPPHTQPHFQLAHPQTLQSMVHAPDGRHFQHQADTTTAPLAAMRTQRSRLTNSSPAQGIPLPLDVQVADAHANPHLQSNTNTNDARRVAEVLNAQVHQQYGSQSTQSLRYPTLLSPIPNVVKRLDTGTPEISGEVLGHQNQAFHHHQQHHQRQQHHHRGYYESPRHSDNKQFLRSAVSPNHIPTSYFALSDADTMSLSYNEERTFPNYPQMDMHPDPQEQDDSNIQHTRYPSPGATLEDHPYNPQGVNDTADLIQSIQGLPQQKEVSPPPSPGLRIRLQPKPPRRVTKDSDGKFICTWVGCNEETKQFNRKCEWNKHMDKHDRPYKCPSDGCEKLPGFTYSGGLLRHQREVHGLHGGPRKQLNCHYPNCKRHSGKGFSRQENLNEHLRRVHTSGDEQGGDETEDDASNERVGVKRKRPHSEREVREVKAELSRLRTENEELRRSSNVQQQQVIQLMRQLTNLENLVNGGRIDHGGAPQALM